MAAPAHYTKGKLNMKLEHWYSGIEVVANCDVGVIMILKKIDNNDFFVQTAEHTKPQFTEEIVNTHVKEMETITFTTTFAGNPKPEISWYHNNKLIRQHASYQV